VKPLVLAKLDASKSIPVAVDIASREHEYQPTPDR